MYEQGSEKPETQARYSNSVTSMAKAKSKKTLPAKQAEELLQVLQTRFEENMGRHKGIKWAGVLKKLEASPDKLWSLSEMERTGGEPDVVAYDKKSDAYTFFDCSANTPEGRRSLCYDREALESRKANKPKDSAVNMATNMGIELLTEEQYQMLQTLGEFDTKTSSWLSTPVEVRKLGGSIFADRRFGRVFVYHNGAESYYAGRGFRGWLSV